MPSRTKLDKSDEMIAERRQGTGKMLATCLNGCLQRLQILINGVSGSVM